MDKLKTILQSESGYFIFVGLGVTLYIVIRESMVITLLFFILFIFVYKKSRNLFIILLFTIGVFYLRSLFINHHLTTSGELNQSALVLKQKGNSYLVRVDGKKYLLYGSQGLQSGDVIQVEASYFDIEQKHIEHTFDYQTYLLSEGISGLLYVNKIEVIGHRFTIYQIHEFALTWVEQQFDITTGAYIKMFLLGDKEDISEETISAMNKINISHLFVLSGMHVAIILQVFNYFLFFFKRNETTNWMINIVFLLMYMLLTGFTISIVRASLQAILLTSRKQWKIRCSKVDLLSFIFILNLLYQPFLLYQVGFQLSYLISLVILLSGPLLKSKSKITQLLKVQLIATLFSLPIILSLNHSFNIAFLWTGILFYYFVVYLFMPFSFIVLILRFLVPIYLKLISIFEELTRRFASIDVFYKFEFSSLDQVVMYYLFVSYLIILISKRKSFQKILTMSFLYLLMIILPTKMEFSKVVFFDVGQGDSILIESEGCRVLIDSGSQDQYDHLIDYFYGENTHYFDMIFITHFHEDHEGEISDLLNNFPTKQLYISSPNMEYPSAIVLSKGDQVHCKNNLHFLVLSSSTSSSNENNNSLVLYVTIENDHYLFAGDIEQLIESTIDWSQYPVDILKVPHHGSITSSSFDFVESISPEIAIISVGENNYGHPSDEVLSRYRSIGSKVYRTDQFGSISFNYYFGNQIKTMEHYQYRISFYERRLL